MERQEGNERRVVLEAKHGCYEFRPLKLFLMISSTLRSFYALWWALWLLENIKSMSAIESFSTLIYFPIRRDTPHSILLHFSFSYRVRWVFPSLCVHPRALECYGTRPDKELLRKYSSSHIALAMVRNWIAQFSNGIQRSNCITIQWVSLRKNVISRAATKVCQNSISYW